MKTPLQTLAGRFGLSQQQLANFLSVDRSMISHVNSGAKTLPGKYIIQLQKLMKLDVSNSAAGKKKIRIDESPCIHFIVEISSGFDQSILSASWIDIPEPRITAAITIEDITNAPPNKPKKIPSCDHGEDTRK